MLKLWQGLGTRPIKHTAGLDQCYVYSLSLWTCHLHLAPTRINLFPFLNGVRFFLIKFIFFSHFLLLNKKKLPCCSINDWINFHSSKHIRNWKFFILSCKSNSNVFSLINSTFSLLKSNFILFLSPNVQIEIKTFYIAYKLQQKSIYHIVFNLSVFMFISRETFHLKKKNLW